MAELEVGGEMPICHFGWLRVKEAGNGRALKLRGAIMPIAEPDRSPIK